MIETIEELTGIFIGQYSLLSIPFIILVLGYSVGRFNFSER